MVAPHLDNHQPDCFVFWLQSCRCLAVVIVWHVLLIWQSKSLQKKDRAISQNVRSRVWELRLPFCRYYRLMGIPQRAGTGTELPSYCGALQGPLSW